MKKFEMFVITHKKIPVIMPKNYIPIQVGKLNTNLELPYIIDNTGDNISDKNSNYCELTALYWLWKNYNLPEYVGICHYRRYFIDSCIGKFIDQKTVDKILAKSDIIMPFPWNNKFSVYDRYIMGSGRKKDIDALRNVILDKYPQYIETYDEIINSDKSSYWNMMICSKENFIKYSQWLFDILFELENITDLTGYSAQEARIYGYLSEILLNVWVTHNHLKISYCHVFFVNEKNIVKNIILKLKICIKNFYKKIVGVKYEI